VRTRSLASLCRWAISSKNSGAPSSPRRVYRVSTPTGCRSEIHNTTETLPGASRLEAACRPLAVEALRLALMPTIDRMRCVSLCYVHTFPLILDHFFPPGQHDGHRHNPRHDDARNSGWRRCRAGRAAANDHNVYDLRVECALVSCRHALGAAGMR
jgi:hypothetical protein